MYMKLPEGSQWGTLISITISNLETSDWKSSAEAEKLPRNKWQIPQRKQIVTFFIKYYSGSKSTKYLLPAMWLGNYWHGIQYQKQ